MKNEKNIYEFTQRNARRTHHLAPSHFLRIEHTTIVANFRHATDHLCDINTWQMLAPWSYGGSVRMSWNRLVKSKAWQGRRKGR
jgi:hypothetical protein